MFNERWVRMRQLTRVLFGGRFPQIGSQGPALSVLLAPSAMLAGALGLLALWFLSPLAEHRTDSGLSLGLVRVFYVREVLTAPAVDAERADAVLRIAQSQQRALTAVLTELGAPASATRLEPNRGGATTLQSLDALQVAEQRMVRSAELFAQARADPLRRAFQTAGLPLRSYEQEISRSASGRSAGLSPLELRNTRVLAARFDVDRVLARRLQHAARDLIAARMLERAATTLPFSVPVDNPVRSSGFGLRVDPFTGSPAFHPGQDFSGRFGQPIRSTAPGVVAFAGPRSGYGNCIEVDHGGGFKTRYGHLEHIEVAVGQSIAAGETIGLMGSTGRSTGVHLHYEVWQDGQLQDPSRFLKAGEAMERAEARAAA